MTHLENGAIYKFVNAKAGNVMDLSGGDGTSIIGYDWHGGENQKWRLHQVADGFAIQNVGTGKFLICNSNLVEGVSVLGEHTDSPQPFQFRRDEQDPSVWRPLFNGTNFALDLADHGNPTPGTPVTLWPQWHPGRNQCWFLERVG